MQHIIYQHHFFPFNVERNICLRRHDDFIARVHIIPIEGNIELAVRDFLLGDVLKNSDNPIRKPNAARLQTNDDRVCKIGVELNQLMRQPLERDVELMFIKQRLQSSGDLLQN
jgi:hypothetical protein